MTIRHAYSPYLVHAHFTTHLHIYKQNIEHLTGADGLELENSHASWRSTAQEVQVAYGKLQNTIGH